MVITGLNSQRTKKIKTNERDRECLSGCVAKKSDNAVIDFVCACIPAMNHKQWQSEAFNWLIVCLL